MPSCAKARANNIPLHDSECLFAAKMFLISTLGFFVTEKLCVIKVLEGLFKVISLANEKAASREQSDATTEAHRPGNSLTYTLYLWQKSV